MLETDSDTGTAVQLSFRNNTEDKIWFNIMLSIYWFLYNHGFIFAHICYQGEL